MPNRITQFVLKISKFCNLRCKYCYEMEELGLKEAMTREHLQQIYRNIESYYVARDAADGQQTEVRFIWHGGEPLLVEPQRFWETFADQKEIFGDRIKVMNLVQTNLTVLDADRIQLLREGFDSVGVSLDLFGGLRVNLAGRDSIANTMKNMDVLRKEKIPFGCITVLSRRNIDEITRICRFYEQAGLSFRLLPLFDAAYAGQLDAFNVTTMEILEAFKKVFDLWLESERGFHAIPISQHIEAVVHHLAGGPLRYYNKALWNSAMLVNTNGDCYSSADPYGNPDWTLGNLITSPLGEILAGERWGKSVATAEKRLAYNCTRCRFFGSCSGHCLVEDETNCREQSPEGIRMCVVERLLLEYIEARLRQLGLPDSTALAGKSAEKPSAAQSSALSLP